MFPTKGNSWLNHTDPVITRSAGHTACTGASERDCGSEDRPRARLLARARIGNMHYYGTLAPAWPRRAAWPWQRLWRVFRVWVVWAAWWLPGQLSGIMIQERPRPVFIIHNHLHLHLRYAGSPSQPQSWNVSSICARCTECADSTNNSQQNSFPEF